MFVASTYYYSEISSIMSLLGVYIHLALYGARAHYLIGMPPPPPACVTNVIIWRLTTFSCGEVSWRKWGIYYQTRETVSVGTQTLQTQTWLCQP